MQWIITESNVAINLDNVKTIEYEITEDEECWEITAYLMDGDERLIGYQETAKDAHDVVCSLLGEDNVSANWSVLS